MEIDKPTPVTSTKQKTDPQASGGTANTWALMGFITLIPVNVLLWQLVFR